MFISKDSQKLKLDKVKISEYWQHVDPTHPGAAKEANVVGLYGDDCKYNNVGEKLIVIAMNVILFEPECSLTLVYFFQKLSIMYKEHMQLTRSHSGLDLCRYPLFVLRCSLHIPDYSLQRIWEVICWSLNAIW